MFLRERQQATTIWKLADYEAYNELCFLALSTDSGPLTEPSVSAMLALGSC